MGLVDWLRGRRERAKDTQEERLEARQEAQAADTPENPQQLDESIEERRDSEAGRHSGI